MNGVEMREEGAEGQEEEGRPPEVLKRAHHGWSHHRPSGYWLFFILRVKSTL